jgi:hypothetical protein
LFPDKAFSLQLPGRKREATGAAEKIHPTFLFTRTFIGKDVMVLLVLKSSSTTSGPLHGAYSGMSLRRDGKEDKSRGVNEW